MLTEKLAWELLAEMWKEARIYDNSKFGASLDGVNSRGLCHHIEYLSSMNRITYKTFLSMMDKIESCLEEDRNYLFPQTPEGAASRVAYCLHQASLLQETSPVGDQTDKSL